MVFGERLAIVCAKSEAELADPWLIWTVSLPRDAEVPYSNHAVVDGLLD